MSDTEALDRRLRAVERSLTDGDHDVDAVRDADALTERIETLQGRLADVEDRIAELEAATQALRGYVGNIRSVNEDVDQRADAALAAVERLEAQFDERETTGGGRRPADCQSNGENHRIGSSNRQTSELEITEEPIASPDETPDSSDEPADDESTDTGVISRVTDAF